MCLRIVACAWKFARWLAEACACERSVFVVGVLSVSIAWKSVGLFIPLLLLIVSELRFEFDDDEGGGGALPSLPPSSSSSSSECSSPLDPWSADLLLALAAAWALDLRT